MLKDKKPLVSIVIPTYNGMPYLEEAIVSVLTQNYPNIELIVLDDGSTDSTMEFLKKYTGIFHYESHFNMGQAATLNKGWSMCKGEIIGYLSADDKLLSKAIYTLVSLLLEDPNNIVVYPNFDLIDVTSSIIRKEVARPFDYIDLVINQECYIGPGALFKKSVFEQVGGWKPTLRLAPDREFWMRLGLQGKFVMCSESLAYYRVHFKSISNAKVDSQSADEYIGVINDFYKNEKIPELLLVNKHIALAQAYLMASRLHLKSGRYVLFWKRLMQAKKCNPGMRKITVFTMMLRILLRRSYYGLLFLYGKYLKRKKCDG